MCCLRHFMRIFLYIKSQILGCKERSSKLSSYLRFTTTSARFCHFFWPQDLTLIEGATTGFLARVESALLTLLVDISSKRSIFIFTFELYSKIRKWIPLLVFTRACYCKAHFCTQILPWTPTLCKKVTSSHSFAHFRICNFARPTAFHRNGFMSSVDWLWLWLMGNAAMTHFLIGKMV